VPQAPYDVIVVGTGAGGATAAYVLTLAGARVLHLEAGRMLNPARDFLTHAWPWELKFRGSGPPGEYDGLWKINEYTAHLYTNPRKEPYRADPEFHWTRLRAVGGRTNTWGRACFRHGPLDFKTRSLQGFGEDWPISYEEIAPYYDKVERLVGIVGNRDNYFNMPDGIYCGPPHRPRCGEVLLMERARKIGVPVLLERTAVLSVAYDGRPACHYCGACGAGCDVRARFSTLDAVIPKLLQRPNYTLRTNATVYQVLTDANGQAAGVSFFDSLTKEYQEVRSRAVVLAASTVESGRILLNSKSRHHPNGLGNSSGLVGHYLMDSVKSGAVVGVLPLLKNRVREDEDGAGGSHVTIPRFNYNRKTNYYGGYFILCGTGFGRGVSSAGGITGWGAALKRQIREEYGATLSLRSYGERLPEYTNYFEIDPDNKDAFGIPQVRFHWKEGDNDRRMMEDMYGWMEEILRACGAERVVPYRKYLEPMGDATHEAGTARMGTNPKTSVLNPFCQSHDVKNLFVTDASCFVSLPGTHGITTLIMALAWRASEYLAEQLRKGEI
jgi:choline dehydrogenase-like flavoprotein